MSKLNYIQDEAEDYIFGFLIKVLCKDDRKEIHCPADVLRYLENNPDCEEDIKDQVWTMLKYELNLNSVIERMENYCRVNEEESDNEEEDKDADDSDED